MTIRRVYVVVEGQTEENFIKSELGPDLADKQVFLTPILIGSARERRRRGGRVNEQRAVGHVTRLLKQDHEATCTTCLDYYGIDEEFPGKRESRSESSVVGKAAVIEKAFKGAVVAGMGSSFQEGRFLPYIQMHEFEGMLFSDTEGLAEALGKKDLSRELSKIAADFETPEDINDSYQTKPSRRIEELFPGYQKTYHGILASRKIGIASIKAKCPHFRAWCQALECF